MSSKSSIKKCPHCGSDYGFYTKGTISGSVWYNHNFDGSETDNSEMYEATTVKEGIYAYCRQCNKRLFKTTDLEADHGK